MWISIGMLILTGFEWNYYCDRLKQFRINIGMLMLIGFEWNYHCYGIQAIENKHGNACTHWLCMDLSFSWLKSLNISFWMFILNGLEWNYYCHDITPFTISVGTLILEGFHWNYFCDGLNNSEYVLECSWSEVMTE